MVYCLHGVLFTWCTVYMVYCLHGVLFTLCLFTWCHVYIVLLSVLSCLFVACLGLRSLVLELAPEYLLHVSREHLFLFSNVVRTAVQIYKYLPLYKTLSIYSHCFLSPLHCLRNAQENSTPGFLETFAGDGRAGRHADGI